MVDIRLPSITGTTDAQQLQQIRAYLYQLARQLQVALAETEGKSPVPKASGPAPMAQFQGLKALIIKSADIVEAYYEKIDAMLQLSGNYVASSEFGTFAELTAQRIGADHETITQTLTRLQMLTGTVDGVSEQLHSQESYLRFGAVGTTLDDTGLSQTTAPGIEIGDYETLSTDGTTVTNRRFARFTAYGLELFGESKDAPPVAYIKQDRLYIRDAEVVSSLKLGGFLISNADGLSFDYVGG